MRLRCLLLIFNFFFSFCFGQEPSFRMLSTEQGLVSRTIYDINQHKNGKILIGHELGLSVYNGMEVNHYNNNYKTTPLSNITLFKDEVLCRNFYNEVYVTQKNKTVRRLESLSIQDAGICTMLRYNGKIYKKTNSDIVEFGFDKEIEKTRQLFNSNETIIDFDCFNDTMYVLTANHFLHFNIRSPKNVKSNKINSGKMPRMFRLDGKVAVYCKDYMHIIVSPHKRNAHRIELKDFNFNDKSTCIRQLKDGTIFLGTFGGLYIYNRTGKLLRHCFQDIQITCIFQDIESNIWLGTIHDGIRIIPNLSIQTVLLESNEKISRINSDNPNHLLLGTFDGKLYKIKKEGTKKLVYDFESNNEIQSIYTDDNSVWLFCVYMYQLRDGELVSKLIPNPTKDILIKGDTLICSTSKGVQLITNEKFQPTIRAELWVKKSVRFGSGVLFETSKGIMELKNMNLVPLKINDKNKLFDCTNATNLIEESGVIYFSLKNCVYKLDVNNKLTKIDCIGFLQTISKITVVQGDIFATDGKNILQISNGKKKFIDVTKGVVIKEINDVIGWNNQLVIVGSDRFQIFPLNVRIKTYPQTLSLESISGTFHQEKKGFVSDYLGNKLVLKFELLPNISSVGTGKVYYRLKGVANEWKPMEYKMGGFQIDERRIPYGATTLEVYGVNQNNKTRVHRFSLYVFPPYYLRWWFILIVLFCVTFIVYLIYRQRILVINRKNRLKMEQERLKTKVISSELKALRSQMNPHFIFNSLSSIQSKILNDETKEAYSNLSAFSKLLRQSLKFTGEEFISLENEIDFLKNYVSLEQGRLEKSFEFKVEIDADINIQEAQFPSLFSQPFVENSIRHGLAHKNGHKELQIKISGTTPHFCMVISDNGIGRSAANQINQSRAKSHVSFATQAMKDRIEMINANGIYNVQLEIHDKSVGTEVLIAIQKKNG